MTETLYPTSLSQAASTDEHAESSIPGTSTYQKPLADRMAQSAHHTIDRLAETAGPQIERVEGALAGATVRLKDGARQVREKGDEWADDLRATVRRNPLSAVLVSIAAGALIARITR